MIPPASARSSSASLPEIQGLPTIVALPHVMYNVVQLPGQVAGFLGSAHNPFQVSADPSAADFQLGELELPGEVSLARLDHRSALLQTLDHQLGRQDALAATATRTGAESPLVAARDVYTEKAFRLLRSPAVRRAFHLDEEEPRLRDRYGRTSTARVCCWRAGSLKPAFGSSRSTTASITASSPTGTPMKTSSPGSRTTCFPRPTWRSRPSINDLTDRGLLDSTLVIAMGEFGRTPKINGTGGRDHWPLLLQRRPGRRRRSWRNRLRRQRQARGSSRNRCRHPRRPGRHSLLAFRPRSQERDDRPQRPPLQTGRRPADPGRV